jgi:hypothetical protein
MSGFAEKGAQIQATLEGNNRGKSLALKRTVRHRKTKARKPAESSSKSEEEEVNLSDSDEVNDWGEVTDDDADTEACIVRGYSLMTTKVNTGYDVSCAVNLSAHTQIVLTPELNILCVICVTRKNK